METVKGVAGKFISRDFRVEPVLEGKSMKNLLPQGCRSPKSSPGRIDRNVPERLTGEKESFLEYYEEYLATFVGFNQGRDRLARLLEGYREIASFDEDDFFGAETMALFMLLRHLGKSRNSAKGAYWFGITKRQLEAMRLA